jgi:hypothetical protein
MSRGKDRLEKEKERMEAVLKQCQREMSELKVKQAALARCRQGVAQLETDCPFSIPSFQVSLPI